MKNNILKSSDDYRQLKRKIFLRTLIMLVISIAVIWFLSVIVVRGNFANGMVSLIQRLFNLDYNSALDLYSIIFRNNKYILILIAIAVVFIIIFRIYLNWFSKYFNEINRGIDALAKEDGGDIVLSDELAATKKKINSIKHTLQQREFDAQLAEQRKNDLIVYLAHDLKTPLTSVIGYLTLLHDERQISEELREKYLAISLDKAERLEDLINEFFEITRFNLSNIELQLSYVNLSRMLQQLIFEFKPMFSEKNLDCKLDIAPDISLRCDVDKMQRVFDNLLINAVNYSYNGSTINISVAQDENGTFIKFVNSGNTIPKEKLSRIFEQFYRLDSSRSAKSGGSGLGLAIAKQIIELHGGKISAESHNDTVSFIIWLPLTPEE